MLKKLLIIAAAAAGAVAIQKVRGQRAEQGLWSEATDDVRSARER